MYNRERRARRKKAMGKNRITPAQWELILSRCNNRCIYCHIQSDKLTMDHLDPLMRGGKHAIENVAPACRSCNSKKQNTPYWDFVWEIGAIYAGNGISK